MPVVPAPCTISRTGAMGVGQAPGLPCALFSMRATECITRARSAPRESEIMCRRRTAIKPYTQLSSSAKADDPVHRKLLWGDGCHGSPHHLRRIRGTHAFCDLGAFLPLHDADLILALQVQPELGA